MSSRSCKTCFATATCTCSWLLICMIYSPCNSCHGLLFGVTRTFSLQDAFGPIQPQGFSQSQGPSGRGKSASIKRYFDSQQSQMDFIKSTTPFDSLTNSCLGIHQQICSRAATDCFLDFKQYVLIRPAVPNLPANAVHEHKRRISRTDRVAEQPELLAQEGTADVSTHHSRVAHLPGLLCTTL